MNPNEQESKSEQPSGKWAYTSGNLVEEGAQMQPLQAEDPPQNEENSITWTASEFVEHDKSVSWYAKLVVVALLLAIVMYFATRQVLSVLVAILMAIVFAVYGSAKPRTLTYTISSMGLQIGEKLYPFNSMKSYSVISEEAMPYVQIMFQKRISIPVNVYAAPDQLDQVAEAFGQFVPYDQKKRDLADKLSSRIRF